MATIAAPRGGLSDSEEEVDEVKTDEENTEENAENKKDNE